MEQERRLHVEVCSPKAVGGAQAVVLEETVMDTLTAQVWSTTSWEQSLVPAGTV